MQKTHWHKGELIWQPDPETVCISVVFTWHLRAALERAHHYHAGGYRVKVGGPALFKPIFQRMFDGIAEVSTTSDEEVCIRHNPQATFASRGCPVKCWFCIVPPLEGDEFTLIPDFTPRPILCDNNLSALPVEYQNHIIRRYQETGTPLLDAQSGFEPKPFDGGTFERWRKVMRGPWRMAYDETREREDVKQAMKILHDGGVRSQDMRIYTLIGNEPFDECMKRIQEVIAWGGEPHAQPVIKLSALHKRPWIKHDWTEQKLRDVARWTNRHLCMKFPFSEYDKRAGKRDENSITLDMF